MQDITEHSYYSYPHMYRVFSSMVGDSIRDYIRNRRLTKAAEELIMRDSSIIDIAIKYNFASQQTFTRAFHDYFRTTPKKFREEGKLAHMYSRFQFDSEFISKLKPITIEMERLDPFLVASCHVINQNINTKRKAQELNRVVSKAWNQLIQWQMVYEYKKRHGLDAKIPQTSALGKFMITNKLHVEPNTRYFGFTNPYQDCETMYGYETWAMLQQPDQEILADIASEEIQIKEFCGGLYLVAYASYGEDSNLDEVWKYMHYWMSQHQEYDYGEHQWLEEHLTKEEVGGFHGFKLYLPIQRIDHSTANESVKTE